MCCAFVYGYRYNSYIRIAYGADACCSIKGTRICKRQIALRASVCMLTICSCILGVRAACMVANCHSTSCGILSVLSGDGDGSCAFAYAGNNTVYNRCYRIIIRCPSNSFVISVFGSYGCSQSDSFTNTHSCGCWINYYARSINAKSIATIIEYGMRISADCLSPNKLKIFCL